MGFIQKLGFKALFAKESMVTKVNNSLESLKNDEEGIETMEWVMLIGAIVLILFVVIYLFFDDIKALIDDARGGIRND